MLHWIALLPRPPLPSLDEDEASAKPQATQPPDQPALQPPVLAWDALHVGWWALQFTPRVALLEDAVVLEVRASERLFGGKAALRQRIVREAQVLGGQLWAHAGTALAAVALARHHGNRDESQDCGDGDDTVPLRARLDGLPLAVLPGVAAHAPTLARLGCQTLAQVRALPRGGLSRRFGASLLQTLDQAYGHRPEAFDWLTLPPVFDERLELPGRVESAPAMLFAANRLLQHLCAWLAGRQAGVLAFTLRWQHDWHRRDSSPEGAWTVRLASPTRDFTRLSRLLAEHLQRIELSAPVGDISLHAEEIEAQPLHNADLFQEHREDQLSARPDGLLTPAAQKAQRDALLTLLEKISVRLGANRVQQAQLRADHRLECMQDWLPAVQAQTSPARAQTRRNMPALIADCPHPAWVLPEPVRLPLDDTPGSLSEHPVYQGTLHMLAGPHRIEAGWWDGTTHYARVTRDYYLASSAQAGLLWIFKARQSPDDARSPWFLHGFFA